MSGPILDTNRTLSFSTAFYPLYKQRLIPIWFHFYLIYVTLVRIFWLSVFSKYCTVLAKFLHTHHHHKYKLIYFNRIVNEPPLPTNDPLHMLYYLQHIYITKAMPISVPISSLHEFTHNITAQVTFRSGTSTAKLTSNVLPVV